MLEHTLYRISMTASRIRNWVPQLTIVPIVQSPAPRLQHLESSVQTPTLITCVQSPGLWTEELGGMPFN